MRVARTTGVSDAIVKPRRGISLRPVKEEPKVEKIPFSITTDLIKALSKAGSAAGASTEVFRQAINSSVQGFNSQFMADPQYMEPQRAEYRIEEVPEDRMVSRYNMLDIDLRGLSPTEAQDMVSDMSGRVPAGYTRTIRDMRDHRGHFLVVEDHRPRSMRRVPIRQTAMAWDMAAPDGDHTVFAVSIPYDIVEDMDRTFHDARHRYTDLPVAFWLQAARYAGIDIPEGFNRVDVDQDIRTRSFTVHFSNRPRR